ncbi:Cyclin N domain containing protein [Trichuris trichiura]|uniref:Cyclin N domain containing protein n=1 Tax=Trichuris trichiura TaxID=36087 RepID=A0A077ZE16_TRITR|nr:Cyclin N domain containing protein [Trichuris trichiura]
MDTKRSGQALFSALRREQAQWEAWMERGPRKGDGLVTPAERDCAILWMTTVADDLGLAPDISPAATMIVDYALSASGVQNKYIRCLALSSLYTTTKMLEEPEVRCLFSVQELIRMERVILQLLDWHLDFVTPYTFVDLVLSMKFDQGACVPIVKRLSPVLNALSARHFLLTTYRPSTLAYAALSLAMESSTSHKRWLQLDATLSKILNVSASVFLLASKISVGVSGVPEKGDFVQAPCFDCFGELSSALDQRCLRTFTGSRRGHSASPWSKTASAAITLA